MYRNYRLNEDGRGCLKASWRSLPRCHPEPVTQDHTQTPFEYPKDEDSITFSDHLYEGISHTHSETLFPDVQTEPAVFQVTPTASGPASRYH